MFPLETLRSGERAHVVGVDGESSHVQRLQEIGLRIGSTVQMLRAGATLLVAVGEQRLSLRPDERTTILVEPA